MLEMSDTQRLPSGLRNRAAGGKQAVASNYSIVKGLSASGHPFATLIEAT